MKRSFFVLHLLAALLLISLFVAPTDGVWGSVDRWVFTTLNTSIIGHPIQQAFWAVSNIKITDAVGALFLLGCFLLYVFEATGDERRRRVAQLLYTLIWFEISILMCKQVYTPICEQSSFVRHSPTVILPASLHLSEIAPWAKIKDSSYFCFPADHASIVFQWCAFLWFFAGWRRGLFTTVYSFIFLLPRLISGAHWFSDLAVGSAVVTIIALAWALYTPLYQRIFPLLVRAVNACHMRRQPCQNVPSSTAS
jgi:membrane-associated phospholipid phosphatase